MTLANLKFEPCDKCGGVQSGYQNQRTIFYLTDEIKVRCNNCGDILTFVKRALDRLVFRPGPVFSGQGGRRVGHPGRIRNSGKAISKGRNHDQ